MRWLLLTAALLGALAVGTGAFGAHALQGVLSERARGWYDTAVTYHATHALALFGCGLLSLHVDPDSSSRSALAAAGIVLVIGIVLFSGSLYLMAFTGWTRLGMITPIGGLALIIGWLALALACCRLPGNPVP